MKYNPTLTHNGHNFNEFIDDYDWTYLVETLNDYFIKNNYVKEDFFGEFAEATLDVIDDNVYFLVYDKAKTDFGYKYGFNSYARKLISYKLLEYFKTNFTPLA